MFSHESVSSDKKSLLGNYFNSDLYNLIGPEQPWDLYQPIKFIYSGTEKQLYSEILC